MRRAWYSDNRDLVKWTATLELANNLENPTIVYAGYAPADDPHDPRLLPVVWNFFRNLEGYQALARATGVSLAFVNAEFGHAAQRLAYRQAVIQTVLVTAPPRILLLDPDTGIAPSNATRKHVTHDDLSAAWLVLAPGDWLCLYQHARHDATWRDDVQQELQELLVPAELVRREIPTVATDVALFCALRP